MNRNLTHPALVAAGWGTGAYINIDCSGFCIATQIQENEGPLMSREDIIDLDNTNADMLVRDVKGGRHGLSGHIHTTTEIEDADATRGDMIGLNPQISAPPPWGHIANVAYAVYIPEQGEWESFMIYESKGHTDEPNPGPLNLVRHENCITYYFDRGAHKKIIRWSYQ